MSEFPVEGPALKKLVKLSRKRPINFGYNPGTDDGDQFLAAHKRKQPEMLGKIARNDGAGTKAAFGTFEVSGSIMSLTCLREVPTLAKRMKKLLRMNKINLNVQVLDKDGNVIDSDIEEMEDGTWFDEPDDAADAEDDEDAEDRDDDIPPAPPPPPGDGAQASAAAGSSQDLAARLKVLQPQIAVLPQPAAERIGAAFKAAVAALRGGDPERAAQLVPQIEAALAKLAEAQAKWDQAFGVLEPRVNAALSGRTVADPGDLRVKWQYAVGLAADGAFERAVAALNPVETMLDAGGKATTASGEQAPKGGVALQSSRILWLDARSRMLDEARVLASAITAQGADEEDAAEIAAAGQEIIAEVEQIDARLQGVLDDLTNSPEGREREALKRRAAGIVAEYQSMLGTGIFAMIDQNPFAKVAVVARARTALSTIARSLS